MERTPKYRQEIQQVGLPISVSVGLQGGFTHGSYEVRYINKTSDMHGMFQEALRAASLRKSTAWLIYAVDIHGDTSGNYISRRTGNFNPDELVLIICIDDVRIRRICRSICGNYYTY